MAFYKYPDRQEERLYNSSNNTVAVIFHKLLDFKQNVSYLMNLSFRDIKKTQL